MLQLQTRLGLLNQPHKMRDAATLNEWQRWTAKGQFSYISPGKYFKLNYDKINVSAMSDNSLLKSFISTAS